MFDVVVDIYNGCFVCYFDLEKKVCVCIDDCVLLCLFDEVCIYICGNYDWYFGLLCYGVVKYYDLFCVLWFG